MSDLKQCPVCKGQSGGIGGDGVENDCIACFQRELQAATPRVEACISAVMAQFSGESNAALARYYEEVHQRLAPLARNLELELAEVKAELARRTQPEATAPAQDLSAAIPNWSGIADRLNELDKAIAHSTNLTPQSKPRRLLYAILHEVCSSPANALSAGDRVDALAVLKSIIEDGYLSDTNTARGHAILQSQKAK